MKFFKQKKFVVLIVLMSCNASNQQLEQAQAIYQEAMAIHDEMMPRMDELFNLRNKLTLKLDSLKADSVKNSVQIIEFQKALSDLAAADKGMMDWMHNIEDVPGLEADHQKHKANMKTEISLEEVLEKQQNQKEAIERVSKSMDQSIEAGRKLLQND